MKVLAVDDDPFSRRLLTTYLERWGYEVVSAENGAQAWQLIQAQDFPLVIVDWMMPEMDGVDLVRRIRTLTRPGYTYTILVTARVQKEDLVEGMEAGADDFLTKPFDRDELRVRIREGERIVQLERTAVEQARLLREARDSLAEREELASFGRLSADAVRQIHEILDFVMEDLALLRGEVAGAQGDRLDRLIERLEAALETAGRLLDGAPAVE